MILQTITYILNKMGKSYIVPFLKNLIFIGRPSTFPKDLIEQGVVLFLSGINNTLTFHSYMDWVWPYWFNQQQNPNSRTFIPVGVNILTVNVSLRNWTSIGVRGSSVESIVDPVGMLSPRAFGYSVFPYVCIGDTQWYPPEMETTTQYLKEGSPNTVITKYDMHNKVEWTSECTALKIKNSQIVYMPQRITNKSDVTIFVKLGIAIRPYNCLSIGHIQTLSSKQSHWIINGNLGPYFLSQPDSNCVSDRHTGDILLNKKGQQFRNSGHSKTGILSGVSEFQVRIFPGDSLELPVIIPVDIQHPDMLKALIDKDDLTYALKKLDAKDSKTDALLSIAINDKKVQNAFDVLKARIHVFDDQDYFVPGTFFYHHHWFRDAAFIAKAFNNLGVREGAKQKILYSCTKQKANGFFKSQDGEWDSNGQALWSIVDYIRHSGDIDLIKKIFPKMLKSVKWIEKKRIKKECKGKGLLPAGFSAEHFGPTDYYFWDNFWNLKGISEVLWCANKINSPKVVYLTNVLNAYLFSIQKYIDMVVDNDSKGVLSGSPYRNKDSSAIGNLIIRNPLGLILTIPDWYRNTIEYLWENNIHDGLFFQKIFHTGLNPYLSIQLAKAFLDIGDPRYKIILQALLRYASPTVTWPEAINPNSKGGCMGDGDHGWAAAECITFIRDMYVLESENRLKLAMGVEFDDLTHKGVTIKNASSHYGVVDYSLTISSEVFHFSWSRQVNPGQDSAPMVLTLPLECAQYLDDTMQYTIRNNRLECILFSEKGAYTYALNRTVRQYEMS